jgi:putative tributyrin esterase
MDGLRDGCKPRVHDGILYSPSLQREKAYRVLLPNEQIVARGALPVLYLLHGYECNYTSWDACTHLQHYARGVPLLIVMPDGENSWFMNSSTVAENRFEDYLIKDVLSEIEHQYSTIADRSGRAIAGMSTGGYAAIRLGLKYPDLFSFAGSLGGTLAPDICWHPRRAEVFGSRERVQRDGHCLFSIPEAFEQSFSTNFYLDCGTEDWYLDLTRALAEQFALHNMACEFHNTPGGHTWEYWDSALEPMLQRAVRMIAPDEDAKRGQAGGVFTRLRQLVRG